MCHIGHSRLLEYTDRLAECAQALPYCPQTRLVNRRILSLATREDKYTNDRYVLYALNHVVHKQGHVIIFTYANAHDNETIVIKYDEQTYVIPPDLYRILLSYKVTLVSRHK